MLNQGVLLWYEGACPNFFCKKFRLLIFAPSSFSPLSLSLNTYMADLPKIPDYQKRRFFEEMPYQLRRIVPFDESSFNELEPHFKSVSTSIISIVKDNWSIVVCEFNLQQQLQYLLYFDGHLAYKIVFMVPRKDGMEPGVLDKRVFSSVVNQALAHSKIGKDLGGLLDL